MQGELARGASRSPSQLGASTELTRAEIPEGGPRAQEARVLDVVDPPPGPPLRGRCPHRCMTAWIATAAASSPSPRTPVWKRDSERNAGTLGSCGWSTSWYVPGSPQTQVFLSVHQQTLLARVRGHVTLGVTILFFSAAEPFEYFQEALIYRRDKNEAWSM